jgi:hypothetical protein
MFHLRVFGALLSMLVTLPGCVSSDFFAVRHESVAMLSSSAIVPYDVKAFGLTASPESSNTVTVVIILEREAGQFHAQSKLLFSRSQDGAVQIQNSLTEMASDRNVAISPPLLSLFSCRTVLASSQPALFGR